MSTQWPLHVLVPVGARENRAWGLTQRKAPKLRRRLVSRGTAIDPLTIATSSAFLPGSKVAVIDITDVDKVVASMAKAMCNGHSGAAIEMFKGYARAGLEGLGAITKQKNKKR